VQGTNLESHVVMICQITLTTQIVMVITLIHECNHILMYYATEFQIEHRENITSVNL